MLSRWILNKIKYKNGRLRLLANWPKIYLKMFDSIFRTRGVRIARNRTLRLPLFRVSAFFTTAWVLLFTIVWMTSLYPVADIEYSGYPLTDLIQFFDINHRTSIDIILENGIAITLRIDLVLWILLGNYFVDYISVVQTRYFLVLLDKFRSATSRMLILFSDLLITTFLIALPLIVLVTIGMAALAEAANIDFVSIFTSVFRLSGTIIEIYFGQAAGLMFDVPVATRNSLFGAFICSTYLTSAWLWFYLIGLHLSRIMISAIAMLGWMSRFLTIDKYIEKFPLKSIGACLIGVVAVLAVFMPVANNLFRSSS